MKAEKAIIENIIGKEVKSLQPCYFMTSIDYQNPGETLTLIREQEGVLYIGELTLFQSAKEFQADGNSSFILGLQLNYKDHRDNVVILPFMCDYVTSIGDSAFQLRQVSDLVNKSISASVIMQYNNQSVGGTAWLQFAGYRASLR